LLRIKEEPLGVFRRILAARSKDEIENAQDGGVVFSEVSFEQKSIDGAIVAAMKEGFWEPSPGVAKNFDDVIASARTKFGISPNLCSFVMPFLKNILTVFASVFQ